MSRRVKLKTLDVGGPVAYVDHGGSGPSMVLVHGLAAQQNWMLVASAIAERGYCVSAVELAGFGATPLAGRESSLQTNRGIVDGRCATNVYAGTCILMRL
jgi:pimeloyl-ACP methyl ester carboxylesterase